MDKLPELGRLSEPEKAARIAVLWAAIQLWKARLAALEANPHEPRKDAHHSSVPPAQTPKPTHWPGPRPGTRRDASVGRAGGGRPLPPNPDQIILAQATTCPQCKGPVQVDAQPLHAGYDKIEWPPIRPIVTRVEQQAGPCPHGGQWYGAPVPVGLEPGTPCGASIEGLATYLRYTHALSDARLSTLFTQVGGGPSVRGRWPISSSG